MTGEIAPAGIRAPLTPAQIERAAGVLVGQAAGDALGVPYEFASPCAGEAQMLGGGLGDYAPGEYSDDTQMAVCIATIAATGADLTSDLALDGIADLFIDWLSSGATDAGIQTRQVLAGATAGAGSAGRLRERAQALHNRTGRTAGNGALMRTAIVGLTALGDRQATADAAHAVAILTHPDPLAAESCVLWSEAVRVAVLHGELDLASGLDLLGHDRRDRWHEWIEDATGATPGQFPNNGFTVSALQAAWAAITSTLDYHSKPETHVVAALQSAIGAGNDTDTVAAIAGGLLGARWGLAAIPQQWRELVHGWPGLRSADLVSLAVRTATGGRQRS